MSRHRLSLVPLVLAVPLAAGCGGSTDALADRSGPVGDPCSAPVDGSATWAGGTAAVYAFDDRALTIRVGDDPQMLSGSGCSIATDGGLAIHIEDAQLGTHAVDGRAIRVVEISSGRAATSGVVQIAGFDPVTGSLCGTFSASFASGVETGEFRADAICE